MRHIAIISSLLLSFLLCTPVTAKSIYVNNMAGNDFNTGSDSENQGDNVGPKRSIEAALKVAERGDRIVLANTKVPYEECITLQGARHSGSAFSPFIIEGNGATLDGTAQVPADKWEFVSGDVFRFRPEVGGHQYLFIGDEPAEQLLRNNGSYVSTYLEPKQWCRCQGALHFMTEKGKSPYSYDLRYAEHRVGITLYDVHDVVIRNLNIRGFQLDGINAHDNAMDCVLYDVTSQANGRSGFSIGGASRIEIVESKANLNGEVQLRLDNWSTTYVDRSEITDKHNPAWRRHTNRMGRGARLFIDDAAQSDLQGWGLPKEPDAEQTPIAEDTPAGDALPDVPAEAAPADEPPVDNPLDIAEGAADAVEETTEEDPFGGEMTDDPTEEATDGAGDDMDLFEDDSPDDVFGTDEAMDEDDPFAEDF